MDPDRHQQHYHFLPGQPPAGERARVTQRVTVVGAVINLLLAAAKMVVGWVGQSQALIADGVHSLSDLITDAMVWFASKHGSRQADESHPYGHGRIETAATVGLGVILALVGFGILVDAVQRLFHTERLWMPGAMALVAAVASVLAKEGLYHYTLRVARKYRSQLLKANAWHHRSDAISSVVVIVGVAGTMAGLPYLDAVAAAGVALMVVKIGWDLGWHSLRELVDTALDAERVEAIRREILAVDGVDSLHMLRTRRMGQDALADVHILVDPRLSVSEGHHISETVRTRLIRAFDELQDVLVHIDPEDDEEAAPSIHLPSRRTVMERLNARWAGLDGADRIEQVTLHYLNGRVSADVTLPLAVAEDLARARAIAAALEQAAAGVDEIERVRVYFR